MRDRGILLAGFAVLAIGSPAAAQPARVTTDRAEFRTRPDGAVLATIMEGTPLEPGQRRGAWREATLEGWIWAASVRADRRAGHDLRVAPSEGENLRAEPQGRILARLREGMLLDAVERRGRWVRVRRTGWLPAAAVGGAEAATAVRAAPEAAESAPTRPGWARAGQAGAALLTSPAGDTLAQIRPMMDIQVVEVEGGWAHVRLEGWVWQPSLAAPLDTGAVLTVAPEAVMSNPEAFRGRIIEWSVQFIALDRAESIRADFHEGEPFILSRSLEEDPSFVYIAVPPDLLDRVESIRPLETITVVARVRNGRSPLMDAPVLDLLEIH